MIRFRASQSLTLLFSLQTDKKIRVLNFHDKTPVSLLIKSIKSNP